MSHTVTREHDRPVRKNSALKLCALALIIAGLSPLATLAAQKPAQPPARLADGSPNWTGFWSPIGGLLDIYRGPSGVSPSTEQLTPEAERAFRAPFSGYSPLKSPYKEQLAEYLKNAASGVAADPVALCFPPGMPRMMVMVYGMEFLQTPGQIAITSEWQAATRRVWLDEKQHPDPEELDPTYAGHSIGRWQGDTLVIDTVGIRKDVPVDYMGLPHSDKLHIVERITQTSPGVLVNEITIDDPETFMAPWKETITYRRRTDLRLKEYTCLENNRNVGSNGEAVF